MLIVRLILVLATFTGYLFIRNKARTQTAQDTDFANGLGFYAKKQISSRIAHGASPYRKALTLITIHTTPVNQLIQGRDL